MRILVIGGTGFIGQAVTSALAKQSGLEIAVLSRGQNLPPMPVKHLMADRHEPAALRSHMRDFSPELVIDCILSSGKQASAVIDSCRQTTRHFVGLSSMDVYRAAGILHGSEPGPLQPLPLVEESAVRTRPLYGPDELEQARVQFPWLDQEYDKVEVEKALLQQQDVRTTILRLPMVYGPGSRTLRFMHWLRPMMEGRREITVSAEFGAWRSPRGYLVNVAYAVVLAALSQSSAHRVYNVAEPIAYSELEWGQRIAAAIGWSGVIKAVAEGLVRTPISGEFRQHWIASSEKIRRELGYSESVPLEEAVKQTAHAEMAAA